MVLVLLLAVGCSSIKTQKLSEISNSNNGFYYALPKQHLIVEFEIKKTVLTKGIYADIAIDCLNFKDDEVHTEEDKITHTISNVIIKPKTYLDTDHIYQMNINQSFINKTDFSLEYAVNGELKSSSQSIENQIIPFATSIVNTISSLSVSSLVLDAKDLADTCNCNNDLAKKDLERLSLLQTAIMNILEVDALMTKEQLEQRLSKIEDMKAAILGKFTGTKQITTKKLSFEIDPKDFNTGKDKPNYNKLIELFNIDKTNGLIRLYPKDAQGKLLSNKIPFTSSQNTTLAKNTVKISLKNLSEVPKLINATKGSPTQGAFYYRIPANADVTISLGESTVKSSTMPIPQLGTVVAAPQKLRKLSFKLHPGLGSIMMLSGKSDSISIGNIDSLSKSLLKNKDDKTIESLEKQLKIKELRDKIEKVGLPIETEESSSDG